MIKFTQKGDFSKTTNFLTKAKRIDYRQILQRYGTQGVEALRMNTPKDTGNTADHWNFEIGPRRGGYSITWTNSNISDGIPVVILLQYGHATRSGTFVQGRDFINPVMRPIFDDIAENIWKEVTSL